MDDCGLSVLVLANIPLVRTAPAVSSQAGFCWNMVSVAFPAHWCCIALNATGSTIVVVCVEQRAIVLAPVLRVPIAIMETRLADDSALRLFAGPSVVTDRGGMSRGIDRAPYPTTATVVGVIPRIDTLAITVRKLFGTSTGAGPVIADIPGVARDFACAAMVGVVHQVDDLAAAIAPVCR